MLTRRGKPCQLYRLIWGQTPGSSSKTLAATHLRQAGATLQAFTSRSAQSDAIGPSYNHRGTIYHPKPSGLKVFDSRHKRSPTNITRHRFDKSSRIQHTSNPNHTFHGPFKAGLQRFSIVITSRLDKQRCKVTGHPKNPLNFVSENPQIDAKSSTGQHR